MLDLPELVRKTHTGRVAVLTEPSGYRGGEGVAGALANLANNGLSRAGVWCWALRRLTKNEVMVACITGKGGRDE